MSDERTPNPPTDTSSPWNIFSPPPHVPLTLPPQPQRPQPQQPQPQQPQPQQPQPHQPQAQHPQAQQPQPQQPHALHPQVHEVPQVEYPRLPQVHEHMEVEYPQVEYPQLQQPQPQHPSALHPPVLSMPSAGAVSAANARSDTPNDYTVDRTANRTPANIFVAERSLMLAQRDLEIAIAQAAEAESQVNWRQLTGEVEDFLEAQLVSNQAWVRVAEVRKRVTEYGIQVGELKRARESQ